MIFNAIFWIRGASRPDQNRERPREGGLLRRILVALRSKLLRT